MADLAPHGFGIYVHWPFCQAKCPYCDFNSHVASGVDQRRWQAAYLAQIDHYGAQTRGRIVGSVFFGGGTPSLMDPAVVAAIIDRIRRTWPMVNDPEITLEANPTSVEAGRFAAYRDAGVTRISMGVQSLDDVALRRLGRLHTVTEARTAFDIARATFDRVSFDLIYARQDQSVAAWQAELALALAMAADHLSLYQLTIEDGTAFAERLSRGGLAGLPGEDLGADLFEVTQDMCTSAGLPAYETSNHAAVGAESRHNMTYWRCGDYVGIGPGAHGRLSLGGGRLATEMVKSPQLWLDMAEREPQDGRAGDWLDGAQQARELLLMGLRLVEGVDLARIAGCDPGALAPNAVETLRVEGLLDVRDGWLSVTPRGRPLLDAILREITA